MDDTIDELPIRYLGEVQKLVLAPGDVVVISIDGVIDEESATRMRDLVRERLGGAHEVMILTEGIKIGVVSPTARPKED